VADSGARVAEFEILGLFEADAPPVRLALNLDERLTVLHGRNGSGKTVALTLLHALCRQDWPTLLRAPFGELRVRMDSGGTVRVLRRESAVSRESGSGEGDGAKSGFQLYVVEHAGGQRRFLVCYDDDELRSLQTDVLKELGWVPTEEESIARVFCLALPHKVTSSEFPWNNDEWPMALSLFGKVSKLVPADRLVRTEDGSDWRLGWRERPKQRAAVDAISEAVKTFVEAADRQYRLKSTELDGTLPSRIFADSAQALLSREELSKKQEELLDLERRLQQIGMLRESGSSLPNPDVQESQLPIYKVLLDDRRQKLEPLVRVLERAEHLLRILNRNLAPKRVLLNVETGYEVRTPKDRKLTLDCLSSGEQHQLVLMHELLFDAKPNTLVLIDEPELSLHVTWQQDMVSDLIEIAKLSQLDIVLATHSPYIVGDRADLMVRVGEPE
jgi:predicted ATPase